MFALVLLADGSYNICDMKQVRNRKKNNTCTVNLHRRQASPATLLACNESREMLVGIQKLLNTGSPKVSIKPLSHNTSGSNNSSMFNCSSLSGLDDTSLRIEQRALTVSSKEEDIQAVDRSQSTLPTCNVCPSDKILAIEQQLTNSYTEKSVESDDETSRSLQSSAIKLPTAPLHDNFLLLNGENDIGDFQQDLLLPADVSFEGFEKNSYFDIENVSLDLQCTENIETINRRSKTDNIDIDSNNDKSKEQRRSDTDRLVPAETLASVQSCIPVETMNGEDANSESMYGGGDGVDPDETTTREKQHVNDNDNTRDAENTCDPLQAAEFEGDNTSERDRSLHNTLTVAGVSTIGKDKQRTRISIGRKLLFGYNEDTDCTNSSDADYCPSDPASSTDESNELRDSEIQESNSEKKKINGKNRKSSSNRLSLSFTNNTSGVSNCDETKLTVEPSRGPAGDRKYNCCFFCHKLYTKLPRHLMTAHKDKPEVEAINGLPKKGILRRLEIAKLRKKGNFLFNTNPEINKGSRIVMRRPNRKFKRTGSDFAHCAKCKGSYSKNSIRLHFKSCTGISSKKNHLVMLSSKQVAGMVHSSASEVVRRRIIPVLRDDSVARAVRYDELLITHTNKQCRKYRSEHFDKMIRQRLRMLGRLLLAVRAINKNVTDFASIFNPEIYDDCIAAVNSVAGLNESTNSYKAPSTASMLGTLIKQIGKKHVTDCIKKKETEKMKDAEDFLKLLDEDYTISINSTVSENQAERKRQKVIKIPSMDDIQKLHDFLSEERKKAFKNLTTEYTFESWRELAETSLTAIQLFNRRRAGEVERMKITDFENCKSVDETVDKDLWHQLSETARAAARKYVRFEIRGKKGRTVAVLLSSEMHECLKQIITNRVKAEVLPTNPYVFGLPSKSTAVIHRHFDACVLMRKFSEACGASDPKSLRGTELRKHMATKCIALNLNEQDVGEVANFMGHLTDIHKQVYRQTIVSREIMKMSKLLEKAQGDDSDEDDNSDNEEEAVDDMKNNDNEGNKENENFESPKVKGRADGAASSASEVSVDVDSDESPLIRKKQRGRPPTKLRVGSSSKGKKRSNTAMAEQATPPPTKKRRSSSPHGSVKRTTWTQSEKDILLKEFGSSVSANSKQFPSLKRIAECISKNRALQTRTAQQAKAWLSNQKQVNRRSSCQ